MQEDALKEMQVTTHWFTRRASCFFRVSLFVLTFLVMTHHSTANDAESDYLKAGDYYQKLDFANAIQLYEELIKAGHVSSEVYYNLGNCYFKTGQVAYALVNYERAKKLAPNDEDIAFNIKISALKVVDKIDAVPEIFYKRWLKSIASEFTSDAWTKLFIGSVWMLFIFLSMYLVAASTSFKKFALALVMALLIVTAGIFAFARKSYALNFVDQQAIISPANVYVKSSPDEKGTDQFIIHEGTKVEVLDEFEDWKKIKIANGSVGWLKRTEIEII